MPKDFILSFQRWLNSWEDIYDFNLNTHLLSHAVEKFWKDILQFVEDLQVIIDTYIRLFTDLQLAVIISPPITGEALVAAQVKPFDQKLFDKLSPKITAYSGKKSATQVYTEFLHEIPLAVQESASQLTTAGYSLGLEKNMAETLFGEKPITGFLSLTDSALTYDAVSRKLTLAVTTGVETFVFYVAGKRFEAVTAAVDVPAVEKKSRFFVRFNPDGELIISDAAGDGATVAELVVSPDPAPGVDVNDVREQTKEVSVQESLHIEQNFTEFLRSDYFVGGFVFLFKSASYALLRQQVNSFLKVFGVQAEWPEATDKFPV